MSAKKKRTKKPTWRSVIKLGLELAKTMPKGLTINLVSRKDEVGTWNTYWCRGDGPADLDMVAELAKRRMGRVRGAKKK